MGHGDGTNRIQFITIMTTGNSQDFGDLNTNSYGVGAGELSDGLRGIAMGGSNNPGDHTNHIDFITIATTGNATEFGDTSVVRPSGGLSNQTRSVNGGDAALTNTIDYVTIATTGNASDFGDLTEGRGYVAGVASPTRGVFGGGRNPSNVNVIDSVIIQTTGNATDFGDINEARAFQPAGCSDSHGGLT